MAQSVDAIVDGGVLLNEGIATRNISFRLVVVVVADEVLDGVVGEELPELSRAAPPESCCGRGPEWVAATSRSRRPS